MSDEALEMLNAIAEVPEGAAVLVKGKKYIGSRCDNGELHTGHQLAGVHPCDCKKAAPKTKTAKTEPKKKKGAK